MLISLFGAGVNYLLMATVCGARDCWYFSGECDGCFPGCSFYQELMAAYPNAKVLLSVRDPDRWYESTYETIYQMPNVMPGWLRWVPWVRDLYELTSQVVWDRQFEGRFADRDRAIALFNTWNAEVQATVPAEKLLVFDVKQGWEPLCAFLGVPVPDAPFPHVNDRAEMP